MAGYQFPDLTYKIQNDRLDFFDAAGLPLAGKPLFDKVLAETGPDVVMSFSAGKDSLAAWLALREDGRFNVHPYFLFWIPGLSWVDRMLTYYEEFFECHIMRLPHPYLYEMLDRCAYQPPLRVAAINAADLPTFDFSDIDNIVAERHQLREPFCAIGMRAADNLERRRMILQQGSLGLGKRRYFYPIWEWKINDVIAIILKHGVKLSPEYALWGRTPVAFDYMYMQPLRDAYPADWELVRQWFPLIDLEMMRYEVVGNGS